MGIAQNIVDSFYMKIGKPEKVYPVKVEKHRLQGTDEEGEKEIVLEGMDRGRTLVDDDGNKKFELLNEQRAEGLVKYEDFNQDLGQEHFASVLMVDRENFVPLTRSYNVDEDYEGSGVSELEYCIKTPRMKEMAINQFEEDAKIVETSEDKWWQQQNIQAAILFISAGLFFIFISISAGETYLGDMVDQMASLEDTIRNSGLTSNSGGSTSG